MKQFKILELGSVKIFRAVPELCLKCSVYNIIFTFNQLQSNRIIAICLALMKARIH